MNPLDPDVATSTLLRALQRVTRDGSVDPADLATLPPELSEALATLAERVSALEVRAGRADHLEQTIERLPIGFFRNSLANGKILYCNPANAQLLGYASMVDAQENMGHSTAAYVHPEERDAMRAALVRDGRVDAFRVAVRRKDGAIGHVEFSARLYPQEGYLEGVMIDYSTQKRREEQLASANEALRQRSELLEAQRETILRLSVPVVEIWDGVLGVPLIGRLDGERTRLLMDAILSHVVRKQARTVVVDMTGIDAVTESTASNLLKLARAIRLLGSRVVLCGIRSEIARTLVEFDAELGTFQVHASLKDGIAALIRESRAKAAAAAKRATASARAAEAAEAAASAPASASTAASATATAAPRPAAPPSGASATAPAKPAAPKSSAP
ncbi:MAG: PAS domain S-box protein [Nannocystaceae bacterium]